MNFKPNTLVFTFILFFLASVTSQRPRFLESVNKTQKQTSSNLTYPDQFYLDGCAAILEGRQTISGDDTSSDIYATWKSQIPYQPMNNYFDSHSGVVRERWVRTSASDWKFFVTLYDGAYIDQKFMTMTIVIYDAINTLTINQNNGTIQMPRYFISVSYGVNGQTASTDRIIGQLSLYFIDKDTGRPITSFDDYSQDLSSYTVQISFVSDSQSFSFITSLFYRSIEASQMDFIIYASCAWAYICLSLFSYYTRPLSQKVTMWSVRLTYLSSCYIMIWMILQIQIRMGVPYLILLVVAFLDWFKHVAFVIKKDRNAKCLTLVLLPLLPVFLASAGISINNIWFNLFPSLVLLPPLLYKLGSRRYNPEPYLTRFQLSNWLCMSIWIGYAYLYPGNLFLFSPKPIFAGTFFGIVFLQFFISLMKKNPERQRRGYAPLLQDNDPIYLPAVWQGPAVVQPNLPPILNVVPNNNGGRRRNQNNNNINNNVAAAAAQRRGRANNQRENNNQQQPNKPKRKTFKYTFAGGQEDYTQLTDECAICFENLLTKDTEKLYKTPCGHIFHEECLRAWGVKKLDCPCCRKKLPKFKRAKVN